MEFGIGLLAGGAVTALGFAKGGLVVKAAHQWLARAEASAKQKMEARAASLKSKL